MVILRSQNKITDFFMILAWASPFKWGFQLLFVSKFTPRKLKVSTYSNSFWLILMTGIFFEGGGGFLKTINFDLDVLSETLLS